MQMRILELQQGYISMATCDDGLEPRDLLRRGKIGGLMCDAAAAGVLDADLVGRQQQSKAATGSTIAALTRERDALQQRLHELSGRLAESVSRESAARGAQALRSATWKRSAVQAEARLAAALKRVKELSEELRKRDGEARQRDKYTAQLERTVMAQHKSLQQQRRLLETGRTAPAAPAQAAAPAGGGHEAAPGASGNGDGAAARGGFGGAGGVFSGHAGGAVPTGRGGGSPSRSARQELPGSELAGVARLHGRNTAPSSPTRLGRQQQQQSHEYQQPRNRGGQQEFGGRSLPGPQAQAEGGWLPRSPGAAHRGLASAAAVRRSADGADPWVGGPASPSRLGPARAVAPVAAGGVVPSGGSWGNGVEADLQFEEPASISDGEQEEAPRGAHRRIPSPPPAGLHQQLNSVEASLEQLYRELEEFKDYSAIQRTGGGGGEADGDGGGDGSPRASSPRSPPTLGHLAASPARRHHDLRRGDDIDDDNDDGDCEVGVGGSGGEEEGFGKGSFAFPPSPTLRPAWSPPGSPGSVGQRMRGWMRGPHGARPRTAAAAARPARSASSPVSNGRCSVEGSPRDRQGRPSPCRSGRGGAELQQRSGDDSSGAVAITARAARPRDGASSSSPRGCSDSGAAQSRRPWPAASRPAGAAERRPASAAPRTQSSPVFGGSQAAGSRSATGSGSPRSPRSPRSEHPQQQHRHHRQQQAWEGSAGSQAEADRLMPPSSPARSLEARRNGGSGSAATTTATTCRNDSCSSGGDPAVYDCSSSGGGSPQRRGDAGGRGTTRGTDGAGAPAGAREVPAAGVRQRGPGPGPGPGPVARRPAAARALVCNEGGEEQPQPRQPLPTHMLGHLLRCAHHGHQGHARVSPRGGGARGGSAGGAGINVHRARAVRPAAATPPCQRPVGAHGAAAHGISASPTCPGAAQPEQRSPAAAAASPDCAESRGGRSMRATPAAAAAAPAGRGRRGERPQGERPRGGRGDPGSRSRSPAGAAVTTTSTPRAGAARGYAAAAAAASPPAGGRGAQRDGSAASARGAVAGGPSAWTGTPHAEDARSPGAATGGNAAGQRSPRSPRRGAGSPSASSSPGAERRRYAPPPSPDTLSPISALLASLTASPPRAPRAAAAGPQSQPYQEHDDVSSCADQRGLGHQHQHRRPKGPHGGPLGEPPKPESSTSSSAMGSVGRAGSKRRPYDDDDDDDDRPADRRKTRGGSGGGGGRPGSSGYGSSRGEVSSGGGTVGCGASDGSGSGSCSASARPDGGVGAAAAAVTAALRAVRDGPGHHGWTGPHAAAGGGGEGHVSYTFDTVSGSAAAAAPPRSPPRGAGSSTAASDWRPLAVRISPCADAAPPSPRSRVRPLPVPTAPGPSAGTVTDSVSTSASKGLYGRPTLAGWLGDSGARSGSQASRSNSTMREVTGPAAAATAAADTEGGSPRQRARPVGGDGGSPIAAAAASAATALQRLRDKRMQRMQNSYQAHYLSRYLDAAAQPPSRPRPPPPPPSGTSSSATAAAAAALRRSLTGEDDDGGVVVLALRGSLQGEVVVSPRLVPSAPTSRPSSPGASHHTGWAGADAAPSSRGLSGSGDGSGYSSRNEGMTVRLEIGGGGGAGHWQASAGPVTAGGTAARVDGSGGGSAAAAPPARGGQPPQPHPQPATSGGDVSLRALREELRAGVAGSGAVGTGTEHSGGLGSGGPSAAPSSSFGLGRAAPGSTKTACGSGMATATASGGGGGSGFAANVEGWNREAPVGTGTGAQEVGLAGAGGQHDGAASRAGGGAGAAAAQSPQPHPLMQLLGQASEDLKLLSDRLKPLVDARPAGLRS
ncbi:hypothetical protein PLESTF_000397900 [Pleodorina starrii]|nr:hypothetical protein PLESTF_000397900 [Pleodorina starrii]